MNQRDGRLGGQCQVHGHWGNGGTCRWVHFCFPTKSAVFLALSCVPDSQEVTTPGPLPRKGPLHKLFTVCIWTGRRGLAAPPGPWSTPGGGGHSGAASAGLRVGPRHQQTADSTSVVRRGSVSLTQEGPNIPESERTWGGDLAHGVDSDPGREQTRGPEEARSGPSPQGSAPRHSSSTVTLLRPQTSCHPK